MCVCRHKSRRCFSNGKEIAIYRKCKLLSCCIWIYINLRCFRLAFNSVGERHSRVQSIFQRSNNNATTLTPLANNYVVIKSIDETGNIFFLNLTSLMSKSSGWGRKIQLFSKSIIASNRLFLSAIKLRKPINLKFSDVH